MNTSMTISTRSENIAIMPLCESAIWTCECGLSLVVWMDQDLMITRVTIQVAEE
jgi:hypothetical protein